MTSPSRTVLAEIPGDVSRRPLTGPVIMFAVLVLLLAGLLAKRSKKAVPPQREPASSGAAVGPT